MIVDRHGREIDEISALRTIVAVLDLRFPNHNSPSDRLGRLLEEIGELSASVMALEHDAVCVVMPASPEAIAARELRDVLCAVGGIAHHYDVPMRMPDQDYRRGEKPYLLFALLVQAAGVVADAVHQLVGMGVKREKHGPPSSDQLAWGVEMVVVRALALADQCGLRDGLRSAIQGSYQEYQRTGFLRDSGRPIR